MKVGIQLYTLREHHTDKEGLMKTLEKVKELGYQGVEFAGFFGAGAAELRAKLAELGLEVIASHERVEDLQERMDEVIAFNKELGNKNVVIAYAPTQTTEDMAALTELLKKLSEKCAALGMTAGYHNHYHEFDHLVDGVRPIDAIKQLCKLELDTFWSFSAHVDTAAFMQENAARICLVHLKDGDLEKNPCAIGEGKNDIQMVIDNAKKIGAPWVVVENDHPTPDGIADATRSMNNLKSKYSL